MGDGRQLRAAPEPDAVLRDGGELALLTDDEPVPAFDDEFPAVATTTAAAIPATLVAAPSIFPVAATGATAATTAAAIATTTTAAATAVAGVNFDVGPIYDAVASPLLSPSTRRHQSYRQQRL